MSAITTTLPVASPHRRNLPRIFFKEAKYEFLKALRLRAYSVSSIAFPVMFYVFFGVIFGRQRVAGVSMATYLLASYGTFGVMGAALFGFGVGLAVERGLGWLQVKKASPMPPSAYFFGKIVTSSIFGMTVVILMTAIGIAFSGVQLTAPQVLRLLATLLLGSLPFSALGMAIGSLAKPNSAPAIVNMIYLPLSVCSGLWIPLRARPSAVSPQPAGTGCAEHRTPGIALAAHRGTAGLYSHLPRLRVAGLPTRRGQNVWVGENQAQRSPKSNRPRLWVLHLVFRAKLCA